MDLTHVKYRTTYKRKKYYFCSLDCKKSFSENPESFLARPIVELDNVWKIFRLGKVKIPALRGLSMKIYLGEFVAIMGASGSGKTTAMNMIGALDSPTKGKVLIEGRDTSKLDASELAQLRRSKIGFVFQQFNLLPGLSALENVALPMIFQGIEERKRMKRAKSLLADLGLEKRAAHRPAELSGGEQQRVAMARALANDPDIILADEPTGNLDSSTGRQIMNTLIELHKRHHKTIVVVTHDPYIASYSKKLLNLHDGTLIRDHVLARKFLWAKRRRGES